MADTDEIVFDESERVQPAKDAERARAWSAQTVNPQPTTTGVFMPPEAEQLAAEAGDIQVGARAPAGEIQFSETERLKPAKYGRPGLAAFPGQIKETTEREDAESTKALRDEYVNRQGDETGLGVAPAFIGGAAAGLVGPDAAAYAASLARPGSDAFETEKIKQEVNSRERPIATGAGRVLGGGAGFMRNAGAKVATTVGKYFRPFVMGALPAATSGDDAGAVLGGTLGAVTHGLATLPVPRGVVPETVGRGTAFLRNRAIPAVATAARNLPYAAAPAAGVTQIIQDPTEAGKWQGAFTLLSPLAGVAALRKAGGAHELVPPRERANKLIDEAAAKWAAEQITKQGTVRGAKRVAQQAWSDKKENAEFWRQYELAKQANEQANNVVGEQKQAFETRAEVQRQEFQARKQALETRADVQRQEFIDRQTQELERQNLGRDEFVARRKAIEDRADVQRQEFLDQQGANETVQNVQRTEYVHRARAQARKELEDAFQEAVFKYDADKLARAQQATQAKQKADGSAVDPRASAVGEARQALQEAGTWAWRLTDAMDKKQIPENPEIRQTAKYILDSLARNMPRALAEVREQDRAGGFTSWVEARARALEIDNAKANATGAGPAGRTVTMPATPPTRPQRPKLDPDTVPRYEDLEEQIISPQNPPDPERIFSRDADPDPKQIMPEGGAPDPRRIFSRNESVDEGQIFSSDAPLEAFGDVFLRSGGKDVDFSKLSMKRPPPPQAPAPAAAPPGPVVIDPAKQQMVAASRADRMRAAAPDNVRGRMTLTGRVPETRTIAEQYGLENPRLRLSNLLPSAQGRRLASDAINDVQGFKRSPVESFINENSPAEADYILGLVQQDLARADAVRALARTGAGVAAATSAGEVARKKRLRARPGG